ncbi:MAG: nucleoside monophosphate kinase [Candidatus Taylorbacteria bacterium]
MFGPYFVGKGFLMKLLKKQYCDRMIVIGTGDLIRKAMKEPSFESEFGPMVARRELIPDDVVFHLVLNELSHLPPSVDIVGFDGIGRNAQQIEWMKEHQLLGDNSVSLLLNATEKILRRRQQDRIKRQPDGKRPDDDVDLQTALGIYKQNAEHVHSRLLQTNSRIYPINASRDIEHEVFPDVLAFVQNLVNPKQHHPACHAPQTVFTGTEPVYVR